MKTTTNTGGNENGQGLSQRAFGGGDTPTAFPGTNRAQYFSSMPRQTSNDTDSQQLQHQQQQLSEAARNQLLSLALSGDFANALQFANFAGLQLGNNGFTGNNGSGGMGSNGGGNQQLFQDMRSNDPLQAIGLGRLQSQQELQTGSAGRPQHQTSNNSSLPLTEVGALDSTKPEVKKAAHPVVVPCRARGMAMEHNFQVRSLIHSTCLLTCIYPCFIRSLNTFLCCLYPVRLLALFSERISNMEMASFAASLPAVIEESSSYIVPSAVTLLQSETFATGIATMKVRKM